jgi:glycosyltransferase involved in cell wall biosynthesis
MSNENKRLSIAFLTSIDAQDKRSWSGIFYYTARTLKKHCGEVVYVGPTSSKQSPGKAVFLKRLQLLLKKIAGRYFVYDYHITVAKKFAKAATSRFAEYPFDVIVAPTSITEVAFLKTDIPIVLIEDATFALLHNYYPQYSNLLPRTVRQLNNVTERAIKKASAVIYSSEWAARSAIEDYGADPQKVHVIPMGANFENPPSKEIIQNKKKTDRCRLLFVGVDWQRKGGEIAFETLLQLEEMGIQAELIVCGCTPPDEFSHERMRIIPFLDKNDERQYKELEQLYVTSDFLLLPTRNECFGIVFCEANAFGLPAITTNTGGVSEVVRNGENGFVLPLSARGTEYAEVIAQIYQDDQRYAELVRSSRAAYDDRLNWDAWGTAVKKLITEMLDRKILMCQR